MAPLTRLLVYFKSHSKKNPCMMALLTVHDPVFSMILSRFDLNSLKIVQKQDNSRKTVLIRGAIFQSCLGEIRKKSERS